MVPYGIPGIVENIPEGVIVGLAGQDRAVGFHAHIVERGGAPLDAQFERHRIEAAIFGRCVPDEALAICPGFVAGDFQQGRQPAFGQTGAHCRAMPGVDEGIQPDGRHAHPGQKIQRRRDGVHVCLEHGRVGHDEEWRGKGVLQAGDRLREGASGAHHFVVDCRVSRFHRDLDVIEARRDERLDEARIRQPAGVGVQSGDLTILLGMSDQFG